MCNLSPGSTADNSFVLLSNTTGTPPLSNLPAAKPAICPGCGRCNTCGQGPAPAPPPVPYVPFTPYVPIGIPNVAPNPDWTPTWIGTSPFINGISKLTNGGQWSFHATEKPLYAAVTYHFNT